MFGSLSIGVHPGARRGSQCICRSWGFDGAMAAVASAVWSDSCSWTDLAVVSGDLTQGRNHLVLKPDWPSRWTVTCRYAGGEVATAVRDVDSLPIAGCGPVRGFSWRRGQGHRPGLQFMVSTGRHHGYESLTEARLLLVLDFAGGVTDVLSQPLRLQFSTTNGPRTHTPDFLVDTYSGRWLIDVRPADLIGDDAEVAFAAAATVAERLGWGYAVVTGWRAHMWSAVDTFSSQRRPLTDRLGLTAALLDAAAAGARTFGELACATQAPAIARAYLLHLLWHRRLGVDLTRPLGDASVVTAAGRGEGAR